MNSDCVLKTTGLEVRAGFKFKNFGLHCKRQDTEMNFTVASRLLTKGYWTAVEWTIECFKTLDRFNRNLTKRISS